MYLKSLKITNFRKFGENNNIVEFVGAKDTSQISDKINIAPSTTLIVGKNNSGKTTITKALKKLVIDNKFLANDFNFMYLNKLLEEYCNGSIEHFPFLEFEVKVGIDSNSSCDLLTNIAPFMNIESVQANEKETYFKVVLKYELKETTKFKEEVGLLISTDKGKATFFRKFLETINSADFEMNYFDSDGTLIGESRFKLSDLIEMEIINANKVIDDKSLSKTFNDIINFRYKLESKKGVPATVDSLIDNINEKITKSVSKEHTASINKALSKIESSDRLEVKLSADLTIDKIMTNIIKYEYTEGKFHIPEGQFGLGYSNLMTIIGKLIEYIERYPKQECNSKINLICIEEPEAFMHSQMQELFIKHINDAIAYLIDDMQKKINSQLIITTHSSHILNSKIHTGNSFDNISYITIVDNFSNVVNLNDKNVIESEIISVGVTKLESSAERPEEISVEAKKRAKKRSDDLKFIKKHIKYKVSELFFSDAVIFVEGVTEETLLSYYLDQNEELNKYYISIFNINGAHGLIYLPLIKLLKVPTLIITDLDVKRKEDEKFIIDEDNKKTKIYPQMISLEGRTSTNATIHKFNGTETAGLKQYFEDNNLYGVFQKDAIEGYFATSFEEAFILSNYKNRILKNVLKSIKPQIYKDILGSENNEDNLKENSYKMQRKLSDSKSGFSNVLLYEIIVSDISTDIPELPKYITDGFIWLKSAFQNQVMGDSG